MMLVRTALSLMRALPTQDFAAAFADAPILVLAPHPDDESLGCGGLIAEACRNGTPPIVAILTDGSKSHPDSQAYPADRLRSLREEEALRAVTLLGLPPDRLVFLRYRDSEAPAEGDAMRYAGQQLAALLEEHGCTVLAAPWRHDPHTDHAAAAAIAYHASQLTGARLLAYPIWGWTLPPETEVEEAPIGGFQLDICHHLAAKRAAIEAHRSQYAGIITDDPNGFQMPRDFIERFLTPTETYLEVSTVA
jgi:LmbE family N-acetylglucosaminyl deacetylase